MNSHLLSDGKKCRYPNLRPVKCSFGLLTLLILMNTGCATRGGKTASAEAVSEEVSLKEDQQEIAELRKNIPEPKRLRNDELKVLLKLMGVVKDPPNKIRNKFNKIQRQRRDKFRKTTQKRRDHFRKDERRNREQFLINLKSERDEFNSRVKDRDQRKNFYNEHDQKRKEFFAEEKDKRKEFESTLRQESKDFYAEQREQLKEFNAELRVYSKKHQEMLKLKKERSHGGRIFYKGGSQSKASNQSRVPMDEKTRKEMEGFQKLDSIPGSNLSTDDK